MKWIKASEGLPDTSKGTVRVAGKKNDSREQLLLTDTHIWFGGVGLKRDSAALPTFIQGLYWLDESPTPLEPMYSEAELVECLQWAALEGFKARENGPGFILWEILKKPVNGLFPVIPEYDKYDTKDLVQLWIKTRIPQL